jgi:hypothetical protein
MPFVVSWRVYEVRVCVLPQTEVVGEVDERGGSGAGGEEEDFEGHLLGVGKRSVLDTVGALEFCGDC